MCPRKMKDLGLVMLHDQAKAHHQVCNYSIATVQLWQEPGKPAYNTPKAFRPIVLLNILGKLIEKMVARRLQFDAVKYGILQAG